ncbi:MAG: hypothetical protein R3F19_24955 [Verrucomicrobiales bacterium]
MTRSLTKEDQRFLDQAVQEVSTGMLATKVLIAAQEAAGENGDVDRAYIKLRFRQLRHESAKQLKKVQKLRDQAGAMQVRDERQRLRSQRSEASSSRSSSSTSTSVFDEDGIRVEHRRKTKSKVPAVAMTLMAVVFLVIVGFALFNAL